jgi:hypothetical protein
MTTSIETWQHHTRQRAFRKHFQCGGYSAQSIVAYGSSLRGYSVFRGPDDSRLAYFRRTHAQALELARVARLSEAYEAAHYWIEFAQSFRRLQP